MTPPKKILLAEDDADDAAFLTEFITGRADVELLPVAENGEEVLAYLSDLVGESSLPDAIILDQNMPKRNGLQTLQWLKSTERYAAIPVMIYSTYPNDSLVKQSTAAGAAFVMPKPINREGYGKLMDTLLGVFG